MYQTNPKVKSPKNGDLCPSSFSSLPNSEKLMKFSNIYSLSLYSYQKKAIEQLNRNCNLLLVWHTGCGKTLMAIYQVLQAKELGKKSLLLSPLKALVEEQITTLKSFDLSALPVSGDYRQNKLVVPFVASNAYCMTYEMAYQFLLNAQTRDKLYSQITTISIDEAHLLGNPGRGPIIESFLYLINYFYPQIQILMLSATIGNAKEFAQHFKFESNITLSNERPVRLIKEVIGHEKIHKKEDRNERIISMISAILDDTLSKFPEKTKRPNILVFCNSRQDSKLFCKILSDIYPMFKMDYHNAGRSKEERVAVENGFRGGELNVIFATPTLSMGINVPADICIISGVKRFNAMKSCIELLNASELIQMAGRAGRKGQNPKLFTLENGLKKSYGRAIFFCEHDLTDKIRRMINQPVEVQSQIPGNLKYLMLTWISAGIRSKTGLIKIYQQIFLPQVDLSFFEKQFTWLVEKKFILINQDGGLQLKHRGRIVAIFAIKPETALYLEWIKIQLRSYPTEINSATLFAFIVGCDEFASNIRANWDYDSHALSNAANFIKSHVWFDIFGQDDAIDTRLGAIKKGFSLIYNSYIQQRYANNPNYPTFQIYPLNGDLGDIYLLQETASRIILASCALLTCNWRFGEELDTIRQGIELKTPIFDKDIYELIQLNGLGIRTALLLTEVNIKSWQQLLNISAAVLANQIKIYVYNKNEEITRISALKKRKFSKWRPLSIKQIEHFQVSIAKTGEFDLSKITPSLKQKLVRKQSDLTNFNFPMEKV